MSSVLALLKGFFIIIIAILALIFAINNREEVVVSFAPFFSEVSIPPFLLLLLGFMLGFLAAYALMQWRQLHLWLTTRKQKKRISALENEVAGNHLQPVAPANKTSYLHPTA